MNRVNEFLSDLFFNHDVDEARLPAGGFDEEVLVKVAGEFLDTLQGFARSIGCPTGSLFPTPEALASDFLNRI